MPALASRCTVVRLFAPSHNDLLAIAAALPAVPTPTKSGAAQQAMHDAINTGDWRRAASLGQEQQQPEAAEEDTDEFDPFRPQTTRDGQGGAGGGGNDALRRLAVALHASAAARLRAAGLPPCGAAAFTESVSLCVSLHAERLAVLRDEHDAVQRARLAAGAARAQAISLHESLNGAPGAGSGGDARDQPERRRRGLVVAVEAARRARASLL